MYPLQHDLVILNCEELEPGHYQMARHSNSLYRIDSNVDLSGCMFEQSWREAAAIHIISFDVERSAKKYASRAHRFAILEAGHAAQNAIYRATAMEVGSWEYGGYFDEPLEDYCRLTAPTSGLATVIMYGHARA
jgi:SagB-type dehydrogenase family enzyme